MEGSLAVQFDIYTFANINFMRKKELNKNKIKI